MTVCMYNKKCVFGNLIDSEIELNEYGTLVLNQWNRIPNHFRNVRLDEMVIMPNHIHGIIHIIDVDVGAKHNNQDSYLDADNMGNDASPLPKNRIPIGTKQNSLSSIIQNFKSVTSRKFNRINRSTSEQLWQRNYYDHIIRNEKSLHQIREYIIHNPLKWAFDTENPMNRKNIS